LRFTEHTIAQFGAEDFIPRDRSRPIRFLFLAFVCTVIATCVTLFYGATVSDRMVGMFIITIMLMALCLITIYFRRRGHDLVMATEFQNLLFAGAASVGYGFCLIVRHDGSTVYSNRAVNGLFMDFPYHDSQALEGFIEAGKLARFDADKITNALASGERRTCLVRATTRDAHQDMVITVEPLPRPQGFYVVRGRPYFEKRSRETGSGDALSAIPGNTLLTLLEATPNAHFVCDEFGRLLYLNPAFGRLAGYTLDAALERRLTLNDLFTRTGGAPLVVEYDFQNLNEEVTLTTAHGAPSRVQLILTLHREAGKITALVGTVTG
jgi:PAS domain-containing protein